MIPEKTRASGALAIEDYMTVSACTIATEVGAGRLSAHATVAAAIARITRDDGKVRAFTGVWPRIAAEQAETVDRRIQAVSTPDTNGRAGLAVGEEQSLGGVLLDQPAGL